MLVHNEAAEYGVFMAFTAYGPWVELFFDTILLPDVGTIVRSLERDHDHDVYLSTVYHERWTNHWQDRSKADAFMEAAAELLDREDNA